MFWLASSGLPPEIAGGIRHALANLRDEAMFKGLADNVSSYSEVSVEEVSLLRQAAATIGEQFGADSEESE